MTVPTAVLFHPTSPRQLMVSKTEQLVAFCDVMLCRVATLVTVAPLQQAEFLNRPSRCSVVHGLALRVLAHIPDKKRCQHPM